MVDYPLCTIIRSTIGTTEPRFLFIREILSDSGFQVVNITWARSVSDNSLISNSDERRFFRRADYGGGLRNLFSHLSFSVKIYRELRNIKPSLIVACDLDTLLPSLMWRNRGEAEIYYDQFDPISARLGFLGFGKLFDYLEMRLAMKANFRSTPNLTRVPDIYRGSWIELKNLFEFEPLIPKSSHRDKGRILFYGGVLGKDRGLRSAASAVSGKQDWKLQIFGQGPELRSLQSIQSPNLFVNSAIPHNELMQQAIRSNLYLAMYDPSIKNNRLTASNKLFEAAQLGLPIVASKNTYLGEVVERYRLGWAVTYDDVTELSKLLDDFSALDDSEIEKIRINLSSYYLNEELNQRVAITKLEKELSDTLRRSKE